jgi:putative ABC transport system permease protein
MIENIFEDFRQAVRALVRDPVLALTATATLAICIGANTAVFSIVNTILLRPLPYPGAERIYWISAIAGKRREDLVTGPEYYVIRKQKRLFEDLGGYTTTTVNWTGVDKPEQLDVGQVTPSFFRVFATPPLLGRYFAPEEEGPNPPPVVVLGYALWRNRMGADPHVVGKTMVLDGLTHKIVGVTPQGFDFPHGSEIWRPWAMSESTELPVAAQRGIHIVPTLARAKRGVSPQELESEMKRLAAECFAVYPPGLWRDDIRSGLTMSAVPLQEHIAGDLRPALMLLSGAVGLVLLIACVNLANLLLARASARQRELAVRLALGSGRGRLIQQMLSESLVLALPGGLTGILIGWGTVAFLNATKPAMLARYPVLSLDVRTLAFTAALTLLTGLIFGMAPAWTTVRISIHDTLKGASRTQSGGHATARLRRILVVTELSVSLVLLIGAGLLVRSFIKLANTELGFATRDVLTMRLNVTDARYRETVKRRHFADDVVNRVRQIPMVRYAGISTNLPLSQFNGAVRFGSEAHPLPVPQRPSAGYGFVTLDYFRSMGIRVESGRTFEPPDAQQTPPSLVVNRALAHAVFPGEDPIGQRLVVGAKNDPLGTIVGVVTDTRQAALGADPMPSIYECLCAAGYGDATGLTRLALSVRTTGDPHAAIRAVEGQVYAVDRDQPITDVRTMEERVGIALAPQRFQLILIGTFAAIALILAAAGVYGVMSYLVTLRTREIGIRVALGARPEHVRGLVVGESLLLVVVSIAAGLGGAWALTRYVRSMLYGVTALDGLTFTITPLILAVLVVMAALGPAQRAAEVDPMIALRDE